MVVFSGDSTVTGSALSGAFGAHFIKNKKLRQMQQMCFINEDMIN